MLDSLNCSGEHKSGRCGGVWASWYQTRKARNHRSCRCISPIPVPLHSPLQGFRAPPDWQGPLDWNLRPLLLPSGPKQCLQTFSCVDNSIALKHSWKKATAVTKIMSLLYLMLSLENKLGALTCVLNQHWEQLLDLRGLVHQHPDIHRSKYLQMEPAGQDSWPKHFHWMDWKNHSTVEGPGPLG